MLEARSSSPYETQGWLKSRDLGKDVRPPIGPKRLTGSVTRVLDPAMPAPTRPRRLLILGA